MKKISGALGGGGAKGLWEIGYIFGLFERGIVFHSVAGVSVGALIAIMLAMGKLDLAVQIMMAVRNGDIHQQYSLISKLWRVIFEKRRGLHNPKGLSKLIDDNVRIEDVKIPCYAGFVSLYDGNYYSLSQVDFSDTENFANAIKASAYMPLIWPDIAEIKLKDGRVIKNCVDGGIRTNSPLADILREEPDKIYILQCSTGKMQPKEMKSIFDNGLRMLDILLSQIIIDDTEKLLQINHNVLEAENEGVTLTHKDSGKPLKYYEAFVVTPDEDLGDYLDFSESEANRRFEMGYKQALRDHPIEIYGI